MAQEHKNMQDIRNIINVRSIRYKIEKRVLERIGHVMRMDHSREVKVAVLGWNKMLEHVPKTPGKKRKTILYWKKIVKQTTRRQALVI